MNSRVSNEIYIWMIWLSENYNLKFQLDNKNYLKTCIPLHSIQFILMFNFFCVNIKYYIPSMNIHEHSNNVIGQLLLAE